MKNVNHIILLNLVFLNSALAEEAHLQNYALPTPEQILTAGFRLQESALSIIEQKANKDCATRNAEKLENKNIDLKNKCFICAIINGDNEKNYQLVLGKTAKEEDQSISSSLFSPNEVSISYSGANDQPLHGAFEPVHHTGDDFNGHTYGSNFNLTADYDWGNLTLDAGTDLYVSSYNVYYNGIRYIHATDDPSRKVLQEADEHTYLRLGTKYYLNDRHDKNEEAAFKDPYLKFGLGLEHDSDQGIGFFGGISHREQWHQMFGTTNDQYVNHFKDQTSISASAKLGLENYKPVGKLGFCSTLEAGLSGNTTGNITAEALIKAAIDSGTIGGYSRKDPLFVINFEAGTSEPLKNGSGPTIETDSIYNGPNANGTGSTSPTFLNNKNYTFIGNTKKSHASLGVELGGEKLRLSIDVIYEKNQWNDGDLIYKTSLKKKF